MILTAFHGFCMALADSVPRRVLGGTIAFILGFYDRFINALHGLFRGNWKQRKAALTYLLKLGIGWGIGMVSCVVLLSSLFEQNIYFMSSLFLGLTVCSIPFVAMAEQEALENWRNSGFLLVGVAAVVGLTLLRTRAVGLGAINYAQLQPLQFGWIFLSGAVAITAMVLPGISGSSVLLIAGVYLPTIQAVHSLLGLQLVVIPGLCALGLGVLTGIGLSIRAIRSALQNHRSAMVWLDFGTDAGLTLCHRKRPGQSGHSSAAAEFHEFSDSCTFCWELCFLFALEGLKKTMEQKGWWKQMRLDWTILHEIRAFLTCPLLDMLMPKITMLGNSGAVWILAAGGLLCTKKYRKYGIILLAGLAMGVLVGNVFLKHLIARPRPCWLDQSVPLLIAVPNDYSFPSGHTLASVIGATILTAADRRFGIIAIPLAILIAFSRLYLMCTSPVIYMGGCDSGAWHRGTDTVRRKLGRQEAAHTRLLRKSTCKKSGIFSSCMSCLQPKV